MTLTKPATDVLLLGHAYPNGDRSGPFVDVRVRVGPIQKSVRVFGNRVWQRTALANQISQPEPFERMPLTYGRAFGGTDPEPAGADQVDYEPRNPVGKGLVPRRRGARVPGTELPNLEDPNELIRRPADRPPPACFAPICPHWEPRKSFAGTYDASWSKQRAPYLPADFDPRFFQCAAPDLVSAQYLEGGEPVELVGVSPRGPISFVLPKLRPQLVFHFGARRHQHDASLDTVVFEPDESRFCMTWRACHVVDKKLLDLRELEVRCADSGA